MSGITAELLLFTRDGDCSAVVSAGTVSMRVAASGDELKLKLLLLADAGATMLDRTESTVVFGVSVVETID